MHECKTRNMKQTVITLLQLKSVDKKVRVYKTIWR